MASILLVDDEILLSRELTRFLRSAGHDVRVASSVAEAHKQARAEPLDIALLDLRLPDGSGLEVLDDLHGLDPSLGIVMMTAYGSVKDAVEAMRRGAADYLQKPLDVEEVRLLVDRLLERQRRDRELSYLREQGRILPERIVGGNPQLQEIFRQVGPLAQAELRLRDRPSILLTGETGTGKGMVAHAIHEILGGGPFVEVNCAAMPASLVEAELFGHERGSFTDARASRPGLFEAAEGGTIFLDEIGDLDAGMQSKFLKVIEEKRVRRLGSTRDRSVEVHVIAATHRDLDEGVAAGTFRSDLLHRLRVLSFEIPPLRDRSDDVRRLAQHFCAHLGRQYGRQAIRLTPDAEKLLASYDWPGNVRELRNVLERAILLATHDELGSEDLAPQLGARGRPKESDTSFRLPDEGIGLETVERSLIEQALERTEGNRTRAAALLGLSRDTLRYRLEKYGLG